MANPAHAVAAPKLAYHYINFRGYGPNRRDSFAVLCGDEPPVIEGGYAKWDTVDRPLRRGLTVFQGYDPVKMTLSLRFGIWNAEGWATDEPTGQLIENDISTLEWMAGSNFVAGQSPFVYVNTYGPAGGTTNLIPFEYQTTVGAGQDTVDRNLWPWIMGDGIKWGQAVRAPTGSRIYQEATVTLTNFQGLTKPPTSSARGTFVTTRKNLNTVLLIAQFSHPLDVQGLATAIQNAKHNNPIAGTRIHLKNHVQRWPIPAHRSVWVPAFAV